MTVPSRSFNNRLSQNRLSSDDSPNARQPANYRDLLQEATIQIRKLRNQLDNLEQQQIEPIAIVGMACQFPGGAKSPEAYWQLLKTGIDAVGDIPPHRWDVEAYYDSDPDAAGKMYTRKGSFIDDVDRFDPQFFGISPREAHQLDPQQRLLLETSYTALENAGLPPFDLQGSATGVFVGLCFDDYAQRSIHSGDLTRINAFSSLGNTRSIAAGRIAYTFGFQGPTLQLDTTCSSSLLSVHLACQSLRNGESNLALAGGVNLMLSPEVTVGFCKLKALSADGRCKTFDASADGYGRGEGCGIVVLKRLSDAIANQDNILALVKGSAVNHDGISNGLTAPNGTAQTAVIQQALANAKLSADQIQYVEAHGTGTSLGDPIEILSLNQAIGKNRTTPLWVGSVKSNFGHLESAAGVAGLIKVILSLQNKQIPPQLHFSTPNPHIPWETLPIQIPSQLTPWPETTEPKRAGLSGFGMSGTNVHLIIEEANAADSEAAYADFSLENMASLTLSESQGEGLLSPALQGDRSAHLLALSARSKQALNALGNRYSEWLPTSTADLADICFTANTGRSHFSHRLALTAHSKQALSQKLQNFLNTSAQATQATHNRGTNGPKIAFLFTGQGAQYVGMARALYTSEPVFYKALNDCVEVLQEEGIDLISALYPKATETQKTGNETTEQQGNIHQTAYAQPALFAIAYALTELWASWGISPDYVLGHSVGEYAAAVTTGILSLEAGLRLTAARGRMMQSLPAGGGMVAVMASQAQIQPLLPDGVEIAAVNGPENTVISGELAALEQVIARLHEQSIRTKLLSVSHAFHSALMEPMLADFEHIARLVQHYPPNNIKFISSVTGRAIHHSDTDDWVSYWTEQIRQPVQFSAAMQTLADEGCTHFVEIGPKPTLIAMGQVCVPSLAAEWLPSLSPVKKKSTSKQTSRKKSAQQQAQQQKVSNDIETILASLGKLYEAGSEIDWAGFDRVYPRQTVLIPNYPFQKQRYWVDADRIPKQITQGKVIHPLLGRPLSLAGNVQCFETEISAVSPLNWTDHSVFGTALMPTAAYLEIILAAGRACFGEAGFSKAGFGDRCSIESTIIHQGLWLDASATYRLQTQVSQQNSTTYSVTIYSQKADGAERSDDQTQSPKWTHHVTATLKNVSAITSPSVLMPYRKLSDAQAQLTENLPVEQFYAAFSQRGIHYGTSFRSLEQVWLQPSYEAIASVHQTDSSTEIASFLFHPTLLDAGLQLAGVTLSDAEGSYLPVAVEQFRQFHPIPDGKVWAYANRHEEGEALTDRALTDRALTDSDIKVDVYWQGEDGQTFAEMKGLTLQSVTSAQINNQITSQVQWLHNIDWQPLSLPQLPADFLLSPEDAKQAIAPQFTQLIQQPDFLAYQYLQGELNTLATAYIQQALATLGIDKFTTSPNLAELGISPQYEQLFNRCLKSVADVESPNAAQLHQQLQENHPLLSTELRLLKRCGENLLSVLQGQTDPIALLFPEGDLSELGELYQTSVGPRVMNQLVQTTLGTIAARTEEINRPLRILEVGAGTGGTTAYLLPELAKLSCTSEYIFTDISPRFTSAAKEQFKDFDFVRYGLLNIENEPQDEALSEFGIELNTGFDVVIAANVLHATADLQQTLSHISKLLAPGGQLILLEGTQPVVWVDLIFGLTPGWWRFTDKALRANHPLISAEDWATVLAEAGFAASVALQPNAQHEVSSDVERAQSVIVAQWPKNIQAHWTVLGTDAADANVIASLLNEYGQQVEAIPSLESVGGQSAGNQSVDSDYIVHYLSSEEGTADSTIPDTATAIYSQVLTIIQSAAKRPKAPRLYFTSIAPNPQTQLVHAGLWGLLQTAQLEHPDLRCTYIQAESSAQLITELLADSPETQVIYQKGQRKVARIEDYAPNSSKSLGNEPTGSESAESAQLIVSSPGTLSSLSWQTVSRREPNAHEVEIKVHATGLNFRDVLIAMDQYPEAAQLGCECTGKVVAVGSQVTDVEIEQPVMAIAPNSFARYVTLNRTLLAPIPQSTTLAEAATLPVAFTTAYYSLCELAQLKAGERLLIHAATGGVGQAAIQIAQQIGAEIFATASPGKWDTLRAMGITHIMNSRTLSFADEIMAATDEKGVDVVLNSLPGEFRAKSLEALGQNGRFVEIGKGEGLSIKQIAQMRPDIAYQVVDISVLCEQQPQQVQAVLQQLQTKVEQGQWQAIPFTSFAQADTIQAFRTLQRAKHTGKIVLTQQASSAPAISAPIISAHSTYLITGGMGGLGLIMTKWLAEKGAKHIALLNRSEVSETAQTTIEQLRAQGVSIETISADVTDAQAVENAINHLNEASQYPLKGVVHAAGVLEDSLIQQLTQQQLETVLAPKVKGAWQLHTLTQHCELDFFVLFSSAAGLLGSPGQANHATANAFLDGLARYRHQQGLPALSINWGAWSDIGSALKYQRQGQLEQISGVDIISPTEGIAQLENIWRTTSTQVGIVPIRWQTFLASPIVKSHPLLKDKSEVSSVVSLEAQSFNTNSTTNSFLTQLNDAPTDQKRSLLDNYVCTQICQILGFSVHELDHQTGFFDLGMDSLTALELKNSLQTNLGLSLPSTLAFDYPTVDALLNYLAAQLIGDAAESASIEADSTEISASDLGSDELTEDELTEDELATQMDQKLADLDNLFEEDSP
ncbi:MAG: SDR family NAD(P)-dependent oxidoreductase [Cyanobacteria bacterium P01_D01_bin.105]